MQPPRLVLHRHTKTIRNHRARSIDLPSLRRRGVKTFGDLGKLIAMLLKVPYSAGKQFIDIHYGQHKPFRNALWHGGTGSRTKGAKAQMIHRWMTQGNADVY